MFQFQLRKRGLPSFFSLTFHLVVVEGWLVRQELLLVLRLKIFLYVRFSLVGLGVSDSNVNLMRRMDASVSDEWNW
ncbi:hypothetical protein O6P43_017223 [Quillaja saponaria]|uniref:Uncharacterized protein n=1 Tax=Quillaja saponaria TaxID=32244 RepID=A0AAD7PN45_QUISA|nr:hypothetical protein O6P43_017223 [Quillaja saponaria]